MRDPQFFLDILVTAVEGGSNYWAAFRITEGNSTDYRQVEVSDAESNDFDPVLIGTDDMERGYSLALQKTNERTRQQLATNDAGMIDADLADIVMQYAVHGDIIYG